MKYTLLQCAQCKTALPAEAMNTPALIPCPGCGTPQRALVFPARLEDEVPAEPAPALPGEAACFRHGDRAATATCEGCGRFTCGFDDLPFGERHYCPECIERGRREGTLPFLIARRVRYDRVVLGLATLPILTWPFTLVTAPVSFFLALFLWRRPLSIVPQARINYLLALLAAGAQCAGWFFLLYFIVQSITGMRQDLGVQ